MENFPIGLDKKVSCFLNTEAKTIVDNFCRKRNEKPYISKIVVYGASEDFREKISNKILENLPKDKPIILVEEKYLFGKFDFYVDAGEILEWAREYLGAN